VGLSFAGIQLLLAAYPQIQCLVVGYSGGVDSRVLLHLLATHRAELDQRTLAAVYVDHGLHPESGQWGLHCEQVCRELGVNFSKLRVNARPAVGESPEAAARRARYHALGGLLAENDALLTAHHLDDQAETVLLQLLRGAGPHGLAAMPIYAALGKGGLLRPLLATRRSEILTYASFHRLQWIEDSSNVDLHRDRNYLRHEILPRLKARWPSSTRNLARSASWCAEAARLLDSQADEDLTEAACERPDCLVIPVLRSLDEGRLRNALRRWLRRLQLPSPGALHLQHIIQDAMSVHRDRQPLIHWPGCEVRRYRDKLFAMAPRPPHDPTRTVSWSFHSPLVIAGIGHLRLQVARGRGLRAATLSGCALTVRFRRGGERLQPVGCKHHQELKKLLQEAGVPPWERDTIPLLYVGEELAAVAGLWIAASFAADPQEDGLVLEWQKPLPSDNL
jgi:tRNA(Ile)-lysidine synthase